ncbi:MAG: hypothetical protein GF315_09545 [candidate division Zixibacteria bacterium]|nr:hypothetical protein [candidate division Zixibacteria bacterium]
MESEVLKRIISLQSSLLQTHSQFLELSRNLNQSPDIFSNGIQLEKRLSKRRDIADNLVSMSKEILELGRECMKNEEQASTLIKLNADFLDTLNPIMNEIISEEEKLQKLARENGIPVKIDLFSR